MATIGVMTLYRTSIGKKIAMAVTDLIGIGFLLFHLYGNLKVYQGPEVFNHYSEGLRTLSSRATARSHAASA